MNGDLPIHNLTGLYMLNQRGVSLTELIFTIAILAIVASIAAPSFIEQIKRMEANTIRSKITSTLKTAKAESRIRRQNLIVCLANTHNVCHKNAQDRLLLFTDSDNNQTYNFNTDTLISIEALDLDHGKVYLRAGRRSHTKFFGDTGTPRGHMGHIKYCPDDDERSRMYQVSFNMVGGIKFKPKARHDTECP